MAHYGLSLCSPSVTKLRKISCHSRNKSCHSLSLGIFMLIHITSLPLNQSQVIYAVSFSLVGFLCFGLFIVFVALGRRFRTSPASPCFIHARTHAFITRTPDSFALYFPLYPLVSYTQHTSALPFTLHFVYSSLAPQLGKHATQ